jgi:predicted nuclease with TOPRIM domain
MSDTAFVQNTLKEVYTVERFGSVKAAQIEAYKFLRERVSGQITLRRVRSFFEGKARIVRGEEKDAVRAAQIEEARNERAKLRARLDRLDALIAEVDQEFARSKVEMARSQELRERGSFISSRSPLPRGSSSPRSQGDWIEGNDQ